VEALFTNNLSQANIANVVYSPGVFAAGIRTGNYDIDLSEQAGVHFAVNVDYVGGGVDGLRGICTAIVEGTCTGYRVFGRWVQNVEVDSSDATYGTAPNQHAFKYVPASATSQPISNSTYGDLRLFLPGDTPPLILALPLLDSPPNQGAGTGGDSSSIGRSINRQVLGQRLSFGQRFLIEGIDSPGASYPNVHPAFGGPSLVQCEMNQTFRASLVVWASSPGDGTASDTPADRAYGLVLSQPWSVTAAYNIAANGDVTDIGVPTIILDPTVALIYPSAVPITGLQPKLVPPTISEVLAVNASQ
jgi:hypothetical protein